MEKENNERNGYCRAWAEVKLENVRKNLMTAAAGLPGGTGIIAVVKTDAYGHGAVAVSKAIGDLAAGYAVATVEEAVELRNGGIDLPVLILGYVSPREYGEVLANRIIVPVYELEQARLLSEAAMRAGVRALCHIKADTGMNRIGFAAKRPEDMEAAADSIARIKELPGISCDGIFTHFATADEADKRKTKKQYENFKLLLEALDKRGITFTYKHCSNSAAIMDMPEAAMDWVRQGITLYGLKPSPQVNSKTELYPAMSLKSHVVHIKTILPGDEVSYGGAYVAKEKRTIATVSIGYGDGYPRQLSDRACVLIHGHRAPIVGRVCMDQLMVDITGIPDVVTEDVVTLVGQDGNEVITVEELGDLCGRFNYEFVCDINKRVKRIYI